MRIARYIPIVLLSGIFTLMALTIVIWKLESGGNSGVLPRVAVAGHSVSNLKQDNLRLVIEDLAEYYSDSKIHVGTESRSFNTDAKAIGLKVDIAATEQAIVQTRKTGSVAHRVEQWFSSFFSPTDAPVIITTSEDNLIGVVEKSDPGERTPATEPTIDGTTGNVIGVEGEDGYGFDPRSVQTAIQNGIQSSDEFGKYSRPKNPLISAKVKAETIKPRFTIEQARELALIAEQATANPLTIQAENTQKKLTPEAMRSWLTSAPLNGRLDFQLDTKQSLDELSKLFSEAGTKAIPPKWTVQNNSPILVEGKAGTQCCEPVATANVLTALRQRAYGNGQSSKVVDLTMKTVPPSVDGVSVDNLKIKEKIGSFTTIHPAGQPRVTNIHLISDMVRGQVIAPGKTFSVNNFVGRRTVEKGFVVDHVIEDGKFAESVGGGISQFATTLFNAAFFAGLDFGEYQAHSIYINRYPYGREATISFPHPDLQIHNTSPYGVLIWPTYTDTSITIDLYSTHNVDSTQTGQRTEQVAKCTKVITERTRQYIDGTSKKDSVFALYQPEEGITCN